MGTEYLAVVVHDRSSRSRRAWPLGRYMFKVFTGERTLLDPVFVPIERLVLRVTGVDAADAAGLEAVRRLAAGLERRHVAGRRSRSSRCRGVLPLNPDGIANMEPTLSFNTISSFVTNTNLQHYSGETGLSYFSQMFVITFLQFVTAATGMAACIADRSAGWPATG